jgi:histone H4
LARRGGIRRISGLIYDDARSVLNTYLTNVIRDAIVYTDYSGRKTVTALDILNALKLNGSRLYGFGG